MIEFEFPAGDEIVSEEFITNELSNGVPREHPKANYKTVDKIEEQVDRIDSVIGANRAAIQANINKVIRGRDPSG